MSKEDVVEAFTRRLRIALNERNMTQKKLAELAGFRQDAINHFATGRRMPSAYNLVRLSRALGVGIDWLLGNSEEPSRENCRTCQRLWADMKIAREKAAEASDWLDSRLSPRGGRE